jgi:hypothetical protein
MVHKKTVSWSRLAFLVIIGSTSLSGSPLAADSLFQKTSKGLFHTAQAIGGLAMFKHVTECFEGFRATGQPGDLLGIIIAVCSGCTLEREAFLGFKELCAKKTIARRACDKARQVINRVESRCC